MPRKKGNGEIASLVPKVLIEIRDEIRGLRGGQEEMRGDIRSLREEMGAMRSELRGEIHGLRVEMNAKFDGLHAILTDLVKYIQTKVPSIERIDAMEARLRALEEGRQ